MSELLTEIGRDPERPLRSATVLSVSNGRAKIELATGAVIPDALLVGGASAGQSVRVAYQGGQYIVYGGAADAGASVSVAGTTSGGSGAGGAPTPHDWLGVHHTLPSGSAGLFAATPSTASGAVSMRGIVLSDFQAAADARYALDVRTITAGAGLTGGGDLTANRTLDVGQGDGIAVDADSIRVRRATPSGLSFSAGGLQVDDSVAGAGLGIASKVMSVNESYAFTWGARHTYNAGLTIAAGQTLRFGSDVDLLRKGADILALATGDAMESTTFQSGVSGWRISSAGLAEFENVRVRGELSASVFTINEIAASAGTLGVFASASVVWSDFTTPASLNGTGTLLARNSDAGTPLFAVGDRLEIKAWTGAAIVDIWLEVTARTDNTTHTSYSVTLRSGSTGVVIPAGVAIADWGPSGSGAVTLSADGTIGASANLSVQSHAGSPWSARTLHVRIGNLNGSYGYAANTYGFAAGDGATTFISADATNGFRAVNNTINRFAVDTSGNVTLRDGGGVARISLTSAGVVQVNDGAGVARVLVDSGGLKLRDNAGNAAITLDASGNSQFSGVMTIASSGEIRQGTGSLTASPATYTGLRMWRDGNVGRIGGYNNGTLQWSSDTNGSITAGAEKILIGSSGVSIEAQTSAYTIDQRAIRWRTASGAIEFAGVFGVEESGQRAAVLGSTQFSFNSIYGMVRAGYTPNVAGSQYVVQEVGDVNNNGVTSSPYGKTTLTTTAFSVSGGLNVGSASGAATGQIRASGTITGAALVAGTGSSGVEWFGDAGLGTYYALQGAPSYYRITADTFASGFTTFKRGNASGATNAVADNSYLGVNGYYGWTGSAYARGGFVAMLSNGAFTSANSSARMEFWVTAASSNTEERVMTLRNARVGVGTTDPQYAIDCTAGSINTSFFFRVNGTQVITSRRTGWAAPTGTATRTTFATGTVTTAQLAERVKALIDDLTTHGLIGA